MTEFVYSFFLPILSGVTLIFLYAGYRELRRLRSTKQLEQINYKLENNEEQLATINENVSTIHADISGKVVPQLELFQGFYNVLKSDSLPSLKDLLPVLAELGVKQTVPLNADESAVAFGVSFLPVGDVTFIISEKRKFHDFSFRCFFCKIADLPQDLAFDLVHLNGTHSFGSVGFERYGDALFLIVTRSSFIPFQLLDKTHLNYLIAGMLKALVLVKENLEQKGVPFSPADLRAYVVATQAHSPN